MKKTQTQPTETLENIAEMYQEIINIRDISDTTASSEKLAIMDENFRELKKVFKIEDIKDEDDVLSIVANYIDDETSKAKPTKKTVKAKPNFEKISKTGVVLEKGCLLIETDKVLTPKNEVVSLEKYYSLMRNKLKVISFEEDIDGRLYCDYKSSSLDYLIYNVNESLQQKVIFFGINGNGEFEMVLFNVSASDNGILSSYSILELEDYKQALYYLNNGQLLSDAEIGEFRNAVIEYLVTKGFDETIHHTGDYLEYAMYKMKIENSIYKIIFKNKQLSNIKLELTLKSTVANKDISKVLL